ncbi:relaxase/mobilization nuclease domain-containing protein [Candidatus Corynebacterium faecigallinarum]|uniref:relaxase/mobilization nuclease domain-containing protein n=1 Tax=Candidatus Corynebacterium faecigallinarum TaxID=2838528 RepID=UPI003FD5593C
MSTLVGSHLRRPGVPGWVRYCGRLELPADERKRAVPVTISDMGEPWDAARNIETLLKGTPRTNGGESLVMSFPEYEMDVNNPEHQQWVGQLAYEHAKRAAPHSPAMVFVHTDSHGKKLHAHVLIVNHDVETGLSNQSKMDIKHLRKINDGLMREEGLEVCSERDLSVSRSWAEIIANREAELDGADELVKANPSAKVDKNATPLTVDDALTRETTRQYLAQEINAELTDQASQSANVTPETLSKGLYENRHVSMTILPDNGYGHTITYGAVDEDGKTVRNSTVSKTGKTRSMKVAAKDKQMGAAYSYEGMEKLISQRVEYYDRVREEEATKAAPKLRMPETTAEQRARAQRVRDALAEKRGATPQRKSSQQLLDAQRETNEERAATQPTPMSPKNAVPSPATESVDAVGEPRQEADAQVAVDAGEAARRHRKKAQNESEAHEQNQPVAPDQDHDEAMRVALRRTPAELVHAAQGVRVTKAGKTVSAHASIKGVLRGWSERGKLQDVPPGQAYMSAVAAHEQTGVSPDLGKMIRRQMKRNYSDQFGALSGHAGEKDFKEFCRPRYDGPDTRSPSQKTAADKRRDRFTKAQKTRAKDTGRGLGD